MRVAFCHPDLGLGGAERLVVDAAAELAQAGNQVHVYTAYHDRRRCFPETVDGTFPVSVAGGWFPRNLFGRMVAFCAYARCTLVAIWLAWTAWRQSQPFDIVFVDQVSVVVPVLKCLTRSKVIFYCHYPDYLLASKQGQLHRIYRLPLDWLEQTTTGQADCILVNSNFTKGIFSESFSRLAARGIRPQVLHPAVQLPTNVATAMVGRGMDLAQQFLSAKVAAWLSDGSRIYLSINRFERKKNVGLAVRALHDLVTHQSWAGQKWLPGVRLVLAGGYDERLAENREHFRELQALVSRLGLDRQVLFMPSITDVQKWALLAACTAVIYTPEKEHFGIVPLEAMAYGRPVIAVNSGGPRETVVHGKTGLLCTPEPASFAEAMASLADIGDATEMGKLAQGHVHLNFSRDAFGERLNDIMQDLLMTSRSSQQQLHARN